MTRDGTELDWQAFQYVAGDLNSEEAGQFEARLAIDQAAREAVAAAVGLSEVVATTECRPLELVSPASVLREHSVHSLKVRSLAWLGWGAAACLLVVAFVQQSGWNPLFSKSPLQNSAAFSSSSDGNVDSAASGMGGSGVSGHGPQSAPDLALAWVHTRANVSVAERPEDDANHEGQSAGSETLGAEDGRQDEAVIAAPSWMVIAVAGLNVDRSEVE